MCNTTLTTYKPLTDEQRMHRAYNANNRLHVWAAHGISRALLRETHTPAACLQAAWDGLKIPFGLTRFDEMHNTVGAVMKATPYIERVVRHSLGGRTAFDVARLDVVNATMHGAPVWDLQSVLGPQTNQPAARYRPLLGHKQINPHRGMDMD